MRWYVVKDAAGKVAVAVCVVLLLWMLAVVAFVLTTMAYREVRCAACGGDGECAYYCQAVRCEPYTPAYDGSEVER